MAKRPAEDEEDEVPVVRKRRYNPKKAGEDDDEDAPGPGGKKGKQEDDDEDDEDGDSISTGNVYLDITLDFRDDCIEWAQAHLLYAIIIGVVSFLIFGTLLFLFVSSWVRYLNRPSLETVARAYDLGYFPETKLLADEALRYVSPNTPEIRCSFLFLQGAALCAIAERVTLADQYDYYRTAANYLKESAIYNFMPERTAEGWFLLGKSLYHCGELEQCRDPLRFALEDGYPHTKDAHWYLANAYFLGGSPDLDRSRQYLQRYQNEPTALEEEIDESRLLETMIVLQTKTIKEAEEVLTKVSHFDRFALLRNFVEGLIEFYKAREVMRLAVDLENDPNPSLQRYVPVAPAPVNPMSMRIEPVRPPPETPIAPAPVAQMDAAALREFMLLNNPPAPVLGTFDDTSEVQQRFAEMRARYAENMADDEAIILPREDTIAAPEPPEPPTEIVIDPLAEDPILQRIKEYRTTAAEHYHNAIKRFNTVINLADSTNRWGRAARLLTGICYMEMGDSREADNFFRSLVEGFPTSPEAAAANFLLGGYDRTMGNSDAAFRSFAQTFEHLRQNQNYASHWLPKTMIVEQCAAKVRSDMEKQRYADAIQLLELLNDVMPPIEQTRLMGEVYESWATTLHAQAEVTFGEQGNQLAREAEQKWRGAGAAFAKLAQLVSNTLEFSELLWRGAENYRVGKDFRGALLEYQKFIRANVLDHRPEVSLRLGEMYLHLDHLEESARVLEEALGDFPAHFLLPQIRLVLSYVYFEQKEWERARALLQLNLIGDAAPSSTPYRDSMFELGKISFAMGDLDAAIPYLEDALKIHPDAIQAADANHTLARASLRLAREQLEELSDNSPSDIRRSIESIVQTHRRRALSHLEQTESILTDRQQGIGLTQAEKLMLRNVHFMICATLMDMEQYEQAISRFNTAAMMYQDREEALDALVQMAYAQRMLGSDAESLTTLRRAEVILKQLEKNGTITDGTNWRNVIQRQMRR